VGFETGLGGRLDATNLVTPLASVLTSIDLDHQKWLGQTLTEIAIEKAGIIKPGIPVVSGPQFPAVRVVLERVANERSASFSYSESPVQDLFVGLTGAHQRVNAAIAVQALRKAGVTFNQKALTDGSPTFPGPSISNDRRTNNLDGPTTRLPRNAWFRRGEVRPRTRPFREACA
jgi:dihydrofolate synthase/folylpolyglutamate synthase